MSPPPAPNPSTNPIVAGILIGGKSTRMGTDKALLPWRSATLLESVVATARRITPDCVLLGRADATDPMPPALETITRLPDAASAAGPIAGLASLLAHHPDRWCLLLACDMPHLTPAVITALIRHLPPPQPPAPSIIAYQTPRGLEPCCALYHPRILPAVERAIADNRRALHRLIRSLPHTAIPSDAPTARALSNINTPADYHHLPQPPP